MNWEKDDLPLESLRERKRKPRAELNPGLQVLIIAVFVAIGLFVAQNFGSYFRDTVVPFYTEPETPLVVAATSASTSGGPVTETVASDRTNSFRLWVPDNAQCQYGKRLGGDYLDLWIEDHDTLFCVVPICVENISNETKSLTGITWYLHSNDGLRFEIHPAAYFYLEDTNSLTIRDSRPINLIDIPPTITRCGSLVFVVTYKTQLSETLTLEANWLWYNAKFEIPNRLP